jgi:hypothetical protein
MKETIHNLNEKGLLSAKCKIEIKDRSNGQMYQYPQRCILIKPGICNYQRMENDDYSGIFS